MAKHVLFGVTPVSTKSVGIVARRPKPRDVRGYAAMRRLVHDGSAKTRETAKSA